METLTKIDWAQLGPYSALLVAIMVVLLGLAPMFFKWVYRREDLSAAERKQRAEIEAAERSKRDEREAAKDKALLDFVSTINQAIDKIIDKVDLVHDKIHTSESRMIEAVQSSEAKIRSDINKMRGDIWDQKQDRLLEAVKGAGAHHAPPSARNPLQSSPGG